MRSLFAAALILAVSIALPASAQIPDGGGPNGDYISYNHCIDPYRGTDERIAACQRSLTTGTGTSDTARFELADLFIRKHDFGRALEATDTLLSRFDSSGDHRKQADNPRAAILSKRAAVYALMRKNEDALAAFDEIFAISDDEGAPSVDRCWVRALTGQGLDLALADCNKALAVRASSSGYYFCVRGFVYLKLGRFQEALEDLNKALDKDSHYWFALFLRGVVERRLGQTEAGDVDLAKAQRRDVGLADEMSAYGVTP